MPACYNRNDGRGQKRIGNMKGFNLLIAFLALVGVGWLITFLVGLYIMISVPDDSIAARTGQFGDVFGWVNSLSSGIALIGVAWTIFHQDKERQDSLRSQNEMLEMQSRSAKITALRAALEIKNAAKKIFEQGRNMKTMEIAGENRDVAEYGLELLNKQIGSLDQMINDELEALHPNWMEVLNTNHREVHDNERRRHS